MFCFWKLVKQIKFISMGLASYQHVLVRGGYWAGPSLQAKDSRNRYRLSLPHCVAVCGWKGLAG